MAIPHNSCHQWLSLLLCSLLLLQTKAYPLIFPEKAEAIGAVCLDGSPPAYHFIEGTVENKDNWLIYMEGGGWCENIEDCKSKTLEHKGSSKHMMKNTEFSGDVDFGFNGMLSRDPAYNPSEFVNWNLVIMRYCDGSSFTGDVKQPVDNLYFRGKRIFKVITDELLNKGLKNAKQVFLSGGSSGAVSVALHCDRFRKLVPNTPKFKCLMDGGYFIHREKDPKQVQGFELTFKNVVSLHNSTGMLPQTCTEKMKDKPYLCMFPQYLVEDMETPIFILMSSYDVHQMNVSMHESFVVAYKSVKEHVNKLSTPIYEGLKDLRLQLLDALPNKPSIGIFINNCLFHTEIATFYWNTTNIQVNNVTDAKAISDWYFDGEKVNLIEKIDLIKDCYSNVYLASK